MSCLWWVELLEFSVFHGLWMVRVTRVIWIARAFDLFELSGLKVIWIVRAITYLSCSLSERFELWELLGGMRVQVVHSENSVNWERTYFQGKNAKVDETRVGELTQFPLVDTHEKVQGEGGDHRCKELVFEKENTLRTWKYPDWRSTLSVLKIWHFKYMTFACLVCAGHRVRRFELQDIWMPGHGLHLGLDHNKILTILG